mmetsp:Transcript_107777/g.286919  ORF Transcript_107777/g.286919 Transcript_107777/m.286919 type:complete len:651 (-) Transcript_107777:132-2084(-)
MLRLALGFPALAACLIGNAAAVLRHYSEHEVSRKSCSIEAQNSSGVRFLVDNSILNAKTRGLSFRFSKNSQDKDERAVALWGSEVVGVDQRDGWLKVGDCFLPMMLKDVPTLRSMAPDGAAQLSQHVAAKTFNEAQLKQAVAEAAEVTEAVTAKLKRSEAEMGQLRAELHQQAAQVGQLKAQLEQERGEHRKQLEAAEAKNKELAAKNKEMQEKLKLSNESPIDSLLEDSDMDTKELADTVDELRESVISLNKTKVDLEEKLGRATKKGAELAQAFTQSEEERHHLERRMFDLSGVSSGNAGHLLSELEDKLERERKDHEATVMDLVRTAQKKSLKNEKTFRDLSDGVDYLVEKVQTLQAKLNASEDVNFTDAPIYKEVSGPKKAAASSGNSSSNDALDDILLSASVANTQTVGTSASLARVDSNEQLQTQSHLQKQVQEVQQRSDDLLMMASNQIKDIKRKMDKNNRTFQLRFEACERRNTELADEYESKLKSCGCAEGDDDSTADLHLVRQQATEASATSMESLQAANTNLSRQIMDAEETNKNLTQQIVQLNSEKATVQAAADDFKAQFEKKHEDNQKVVALVDDMQEKFETSQEDTNQKLQACQEQLAKAAAGSSSAAPGSSGAATPTVSLGVLATTLLLSCSATA